MSHALYRSGTPANMQHDFVIMGGTGKGFNDAGAAPRLRQFLEIVLRHNPVNYGEISTGSSFQKDLAAIAAGINDTSLVHGVYASAADLAAVLREVKAADLGLCVTVSGLFDHLDQCCREVGLEPYGIEKSLGIIGHTELLPKPDVQAIGTMCGHGLVSFRLIQHLAEQVKQGKTTAADAAGELARQCMCGIFNPRRAQELLEAM